MHKKRVLRQLFRTKVFQNGIKFRGLSTGRVLCLDHSIYFKDKFDPTESTFDKILIANRGEIACRIIETARKMGIKTVAVYSVADRNSRHVKLADEAICIGPPLAAQSYINIDKIMAAIRETQADAVHPGYGFLSENAAFVARLKKEGVVFIGPTTESIQGMGDKLESKKLAEKAGVNIIPGFDGIIRDSHHCVTIAREIGYPVMIKASAGGGGKGMRIANNDQEAIEGFKLSSQEAASSFGDDRILVEKFIKNPRHIEIQIIGDSHNNALYLNERECSIQRRNQKVVEEAPSTYLDAATRKAMGEQAISLCKNINYSSAGTVEFLVDENRNFYFLEMNTRLQVEHPITEFITGIDLVHQMIRVAKGHPLKLKQDDISIEGWAIECRVYAEDPYKNFGLPSVGLLHSYQEPTAIPSIRCDSGIEEGSEISIYYDPMICKLVGYGKTRQEAIEKTRTALDSYVIRGVSHNISLLRDILSEPNFQKGNINTNYLSEIYPDGFQGRPLNAEATNNLTALVSMMYAKLELRHWDNINTDDALMEAKPEQWRCAVTYQESPVPCVVKRTSEKMFEITINDQEYTIEDNFHLSSNLVHTKINGQPLTFQIVHKDWMGNVDISFEGTTYRFRVNSEKELEYSSLLPEKPKINETKIVFAPMPGLVKSVNCEVGDEMMEGQELCVVEAMKMQNSLLAAMTGKIKTVNIQPGDTVSEDDLLVEFA
uniref:propionyl-CoA carboxylase n=1 Tax=Cacopsylla melanoneura TaxID=428564 RepID=A0A8D8S7W7_9HEMI